MPNDFYFDYIEYTRITTSTPDNKEETHIFEKTAVFSRKIGNYEVLGSSAIKVGFYNDSISKVTVGYSNYQLDKNLKILNIDEAINSIKSEKSLVDYDVNVLTNNNSHNQLKVKISNVYIVYVEHFYDDDSTHIQPCYRFTGTITDDKSNSTEFVSLVQAIKY